MARLEGKIAVITGAANGIGLAAARRFVAEGARVVLVDLREAALKAAAGELGAAASYFAADVSEDDSAACFVAETLHRHGRIDVALLNAGVEGDVAPIGDYPLAAFDRVIAVNLRGVWLGLSALMPVMKAAGGGSIVVTASIAGLKGTAGLAAYSASKHAVIGLMKAAAIEGGPHGVRVNTVNPGPIDTRMMQSIDAMRGGGNTTAARDAYVARIPLRRYGTAEEIAALMLFLASDESANCNGATYLADGGAMAG